jgi:hypothetical protein
MTDATEQWERPCLYCDAPASSDEHIIPEAIGGHYTRRIVCERHNNELGPLDDALATHFAALTWGSGLARERGGREHFDAGTRLRYVNAGGRASYIDPDGKGEFAKAVVEKRPDGGVARADGPLEKLEGILAQQQTGRGILFEIVSPGPTVPVGVGLTDESLPGILKIALHFAAGCVLRPTPPTIATLWPYLRRERPIPVVALPFREPWFVPGRRLCHEVTLYPDRDNAVVTVLLYSALPVALELPGYVTTVARRLTQHLDDGSYKLVDVEPRPLPRQRLSDREWDALMKTSMAVITAIFRGRHVRDVTDIASEAAKAAWPYDPSCGLEFQGRMRAALELKALAADQINGLIGEAIALNARHGFPFDPDPLTLR